MSLRDLDEQIELCIERFTNIGLLAVGLPGLETNAGLIIDFSKMQNIDLRGYLEKKYNLPILIENDINAAISGYCLESGLDQDECVVGIYYPTQNPPGVGVVLNGTVLKGRSGLVGEVKQVPFEIDWENFSFAAAELKNHAFKLVLTIVSLYDPDKFVLYGELFSEEFVQEIQKELVTAYLYIDMPNVVVEENFHGGYLNRIVTVSLKHLEPELNII